MKKYFVSAAVLSAVLLAFGAKKNNDPVLMQIDGKDVRLSEFEYLYNKNNSQQLEPQSFEDYLIMFADYKRKVADAEAAGLDTTADFRNEYASYCLDLARPYLYDKALEDSLLHAAYEHYKDEVRVSHIMLEAGQTPAEQQAAFKTLDSLRTLIVNGQADFGDVAARYSVDGYSSKRKGLMGIVSPGRYPYPFEDAAYSTAVGDISPIVNSGFGLHIIRVDNRRPASGEVHASHILRLTRGIPEEQWPAVKATIDSIYNVATTTGADFAELAKQYSEDPGSAQRGGDLGWFSSGMMVQPFDSISFAMADGQISEPFKTDFGYHIIKRFDHRGVADFDQMREQLLRQMQNDYRGSLPEERRMQQLAAKYGTDLNMTVVQNFNAYKGSAYNTAKVFSVAGTPTMLSTVVDRLCNRLGTTIDHLTISQVETEARDMMNKAIIAQAQADLLNENADYRNLTKEYRDGILMFDISNRKVWERATSDPDGLQKYFEQHRSDYKWDNPKYKAFVVFTTNQELLDQAKKFTDSIGTPDPAIFVQQMRDRFGRDVKVERVIASKGENAITDYLGFGAEKPDANNSRWSYYYAVDGQILSAPQEAIDVKGAVTSDYQAELERQWVNELRAKYPVKLNNKVLKNLKPQTPAK